MACNENDPNVQEWRREFRKMMERMPAAYTNAKASALSLAHTFHQELATMIEPRLNAILPTKTLNTHEDHQKLAAWVNHELRELHLCIRCPKTGLPANLTVDRSSGECDASRFRLTVRDEQGRYPRTITSTSLPDLKLMEDPPRREGLFVRQRNKGGHGR